MNEPEAMDALELEVSDFGPIINAKVDLRPLTVFVGPSNTGKSYLAILIYALHKAFHAPDGDLLSAPLRGGVLHGPVAERPYLSEEMIDALLDEAGLMYAESDSPRDRRFVLRPPITDAIRQGIQAGAHELSGEIERCFGVRHPDSLARWDSGKAPRIVMRGQTPNQPVSAEHAISIDLEPEFLIDVPTEVSVSIDSLSEGSAGQFVRSQLRPLKEGYADPDFRRIVAVHFLSVLGGLVLPSLIGPASLRAHYLPAGRTGIMNAQNVVLSALVANASGAKGRSTISTASLSGVLADFLQDMIAIPGLRHRGKSGGDLGRNIEKDMLGGSICIGQSNFVDYPHFAFRPHGRENELPLENSSSMVSELAPVVLYLRHIVEPGNILIVEEPEAHLHPAMQVEFTRQIAALVKAGVRVILTTHSEWLLEELANIVRRSGVDDDMSSGIALRPDQVGAWLFESKRSPKGSTVNEISLDESGLFPSGYAAVAEALHNDWADISSWIDPTP